MANLIGQQLGQYQITALLGKGGMATVYRARQASVNRDVAVKVIKPDLAETEEFLARFQREAQTIAGMSHPHVLKVFDYGELGDMVYLVMELLTGGSLNDLIRGQGALELPVITRIVDQVSQALDYAHRRGIVHRDMKPQNVLLDENGNAFLTDFGIAKLLTETSALTQSGMAMGTPAYMAPEQWRGEQVDGRIDIYALGVMIYEMLTGHLPFSGDTPFSMMHMHVYEAAPPLRDARPDLPAALQQVVNQAMAKDREERFASAGEMANALRNAIGGLPMPVAPPRPVDADLTGPLPAGSSLGQPATGRGVAPPRASLAAPGMTPSRTPGGTLLATEEDEEPTRRRIPVLLPLAVVILVVAVLALFLLSRGGTPGGEVTPVDTVEPTSVAIVPSETPALDASTPTSAVATSTDEVATETVDETMTAIVLLPSETPRATESPDEATATPDEASPTPGEEPSETPVEDASVTPAGPSLTETAEAVQIQVQVASETPTADAATPEISPTPTEEPVIQVFLSETPTETPSPEASPTFTASPTPEPSETFTPTATASLTDTPRPTATFTETPSQTPSLTFTPTLTETPTLTATATPSATFTATASFTPSATPTATFTPSATLTPTPVPPFGLIAFHTDYNGSWHINAINADGTGFRQISDARGDTYTPALSADGRLFAFVSRRDTGNPEIYIQPVDGSSPAQRVTRNGAEEWAPAFSPDGRRIAFHSNREGQFELYEADLSGENLLRLTNSAPGNDADASFSPDGQLILFGSERNNGGVFLMNRNGSDQRQVDALGSQATDPAFSPDGTRIAFQGKRDGDLWNIYVSDANGGDVRRISTSGNNQRAAWSPDGNYVAFESDRDGKREIYIAAADGSREWRLTSNPGNNGWPTWTIDPNAPVLPTALPVSPATATPLAAPATATTGAAAPAGFAITSITAIVNPQNVSGPCPQTFLFTAVVAATAPGAAAYQWEASDGTQSAAAALIFPVGNLTQTVTYQAIFSQSGEYSMRMRVVAPVAVEANPATFTLTCTP